MSRTGLSFSSPLLLVLLAAVVATADEAPTSTGSPVDDPADRVAAVERAFARTMAERDHQAFTTFLSEEAVFLVGATARRGKREVSDHWARYFEGDEPPFSWEPATVVVLDAGDLALSTGPVRNAAGELVSYYTSVWRQEEPGVWRIVFDKGDKACD